MRAAEKASQQRIPVHSALFIDPQTHTDRLVLYLISNPIQRDGGTHFFICQGPAQTLQPLLYAE